MLKRSISYLLLSSLSLIGCSNDKAIEVESKEQVEENDISTETEVFKEELELQELREQPDVVIPEGITLAETQYNIIKVIEENNYTVEVLSNLEGLKKGDYETNFIQEFEEKEIPYKFLCSEAPADKYDTSTPCHFIGYANGLILLNDYLKIHEVIYIKDSEGNTVNPSELEYLQQEVDRISEIKTAIAEDRFKKMQEEWKIEETEKEITEQEAKKVYIGMTQAEVLERWGKPKDINRTVSANGTGEQWVYPNYQYLYFEDGILVTIQN
ncbi:hypothetical protein [Domibacillus epiphyticus]|uniref:Lipoprotein n=1 Tax=Domibacillus epiphyticus TaxID=1714355 RepID=A0A1V2A7B5_9BACI|nr:hypothetical protein [Domibacillus epiphyticus]OMP66888.1 hypothetical protein BTO28_09755 [Domibacillus epiphyticus]